MGTRAVRWLMATALVAGFWQFVPSHMAAQTRAPEALAGVVSSQEEGNMEGVVVTARRDGSNVAVSVVSDAQGRFSFPRARLEPGKYTLTIRAVGYDLSAPASADVTASAATTTNLKLQKARDVSAQINSVEWIMSVAGTDEQKNMVVKQAESCTYCHSLERIIKSRHTEEEFVGVIQRMAKYYPDGTAVSTDRRGRSQMNGSREAEAAGKNPVWGFAPGVQITELAKYLATINMSGGKSLPTDFKLMPRPKGKATRVIVTEYDMPRRDTVPHDMDVDSKGTPWYTDESRMFFGKMDPVTGKFTEYNLPPVPEGDVPGARDITVDKEDNLWFPVRIAGGATVLTKFDPRTGTYAQVEGAGGQFMATGPDGKIWSGFTRVDPKTMKVDGRFAWNRAPNLPPGTHTGYQVVAGTKGPYISDFSGGYIVGVDQTTGEAKFWPTPTPNAMPRRGRMDSEDRYWFGEYTGDKIGMFDTKTETFKEWPVAFKYSTPYTASVPDKNGYVYSPSNTADRVFRVDPKTGEVIEYLMPTQNFDSKKLAIDPVSRAAVWMANTRNARLVKVEPID